MRVRIVFRRISELLLYSVTLFASAFLLFCVQPMIARMILPLLGGSPMVWSTCMVFFQAMLLAGYAYAYAATRRLEVRSQIVIHGVLVLLPVLVLPFHVPADAARMLSVEANPTWRLLGLLLGMVGLPFFVLSTSAPLLQRWFSETGHPAASDPYFLYGASNLGSMLALLAYPFLIEPWLGLARQQSVWAAGYGVLAVLVLACALPLWRRHEWFSERRRETPTGEESPSQARLGRVLGWIGLAFVPSSLMLGVTTYLTTDIAAMPLLWVIPLALYLLTFILTFARRPLVSHGWITRAFPMAATLLALVMTFAGQSQVHAALIPVHLGCFFLAAMLCHGELVRRRPDRDHLTAFYLAMSFGGVLGGVFNALVAPVVFDRVAEYPLALVLACLALPPSPLARGRTWSRGLDWLLPLAMGAAVLGSIALLKPPSYTDDDLNVRMAMGIIAASCFALKDRPARFAMGLGAVLLAAGTYTGPLHEVLVQHRNYFGVVRVTFDPTANEHRMVHGHTVHGAQSLDPDRSREPLTYFSRTGPIGQVFEMLNEKPGPANVAIIGLGAGTMAAYAQPAQRWTFYEIDPEVVRLARDRRYFTYLADSRARSLDILLGDARLRFDEAPERGYALIVLDAFSSDAIPTHLLTREAVRLYLDKLAPGGLLAFHISNRYLDLAPVVGGLARDAGLECLVRADTAVPLSDSRLGKFASIWAVAARSGDDLGRLRTDPRWRPPAVHPNRPVWTDDYSNIVQSLIFPRWGAARPARK